MPHQGDSGSATAPASLTAILGDLKAGDRDALGRLLPLVYADLRRMAARRLHGGEDTTQPTALVHELFLRFAGSAELRFVDRAHFFAVAARAMRAILVDRARARHADKRGAGRLVALTDAREAADASAVDVLELDAVLGRLDTLDPRQARIVEFRYFGGMTIEDTAEALGLSAGTVKREWRIAKAWMFKELTGLEPPERDASSADD